MLPGENSDSVLANNGRTVSAQGGQWAHLTVVVQPPAPELILPVNGHHENTSTCYLGAHDAGDLSELTPIRAVSQSQLSIIVISTAPQSAVGGSDHTELASTMDRVRFECHGNAGGGE